MTDRMTETEAAEYLRYKPKTLRSWRCDGKGPKYYKLGRNVWYKQVDLDWWEKQAATVVRPRKVI